MLRISWKERKTNEEVFRTVRGKRTFSWMRSEHGVGHPEELYNLHVGGTIEGKKTAGRPRNLLYGKNRKRCKSQNL